VVSDLELLRIEIETLWATDDRGRIEGRDLVIGSSALGNMVAVGSAVPDDVAELLVAAVSAASAPVDLNLPPTVLEQCRQLLANTAKKLGRQSFRVEEAFSSGQIGSRVMPELALESACCLALSELLAQSMPLRQILRLQVSGAKGMLLAGGRDQSDAATRQEHGRGYLTAARAPLVIPR
jgi:hypothetical protein